MRLSESVMRWTYWDAYEDKLLFVALSLAIATPLIMWAFRTSQVSLRVRVLFQVGVAAFICRAYLIRTVGVERGWGTNLTIVAIIAAYLMLLAAVIRRSGLVGPRHE